jgi:hypothetical protein
LLLDRLDAVVDAAAAHRIADRGDRVDAGYERSLNSPGVAWPVRALVEGGHVDEALRLVDAWSPQERPGRLLDEPLFVLPTSVVGTLWARRGHAAPDPHGPRPGTLPALFDATDAALDLGVPVRSDVDLSDPALAAQIGRPDPDHAGQFEEAATKHLRLEEVDGIVGDAGAVSGIVPWPMIPVPLQALMLKNLRWTAPISASLREPAPLRRTSRVAILGGGSMTSELEREHVRRIFEACGARCDVAEYADTATFIEAYLDPAFDVVWFCSHAFQDHVSPHRSGLQLDDGEILKLKDLAALNEPAAGGRRRLLVLNVCDAASSAVLGGSMSLGVASTLASPTQSVIAHLWPLSPIAACAFGVLLADALADGSDASTAFAKALNSMIKGQDRVAQDLRRSASAVSEAVERNSVHWEKITTWGAPALIQ